MSDDQEIRYLGDLQRLDIKPGDKFVLMVPGHISLDMSERLTRQFEAFAGSGVKVLVLGEGMKLGAVRQEPDLRTSSDVKAETGE